MRVTPKARVKILRRLLKIAIEDAKQPPEPDPRQIPLEMFDGPNRIAVSPEDPTAPMQRPELSTVCLRGPILPPGQLTILGDDLDERGLAGIGFIPA
jgi:hypothetical protein